VRTSYSGRANTLQRALQNLFTSLPKVLLLIKTSGKKASTSPTAKIQHLPYCLQVFEQLFLSAGIKRRGKYKRANMGLHHFGLYTEKKAIFA